MVSIDLTRYVDDAEQRINDTQVADAAATAMADTLTIATASYLGPGLTFSGGAGTATITPRSVQGRASVATGGAYGLANHGRSAVVTAHAAAGSALVTPWGPRASVKGSTWGGFGITAAHSAEAFEAGTDAAVAALDWGVV
jgi:hypothetical protein